jgi:hypothetical protein
MTTASPDISAVPSACRSLARLPVPQATPTHTDIVPARSTYTEHRCKGPGSPGGARCLSGMATCHGCRVCRSCQGCRGCRRGREVSNRLGPSIWKACHLISTPRRQTTQILLKVLIPVGVILVSVAAWLYWLRRKGRLHRGQVPLCCLRARKHGEQHDSEDSGYEKPELHAESLDPQQNPNASSEPQSLAQSGALELHADPIPIREADSRRVVPEVDSKPLPSFQPYVLHPHTASAEKTVQRPSTR